MMITKRMQLMRSSTERRDKEDALMEGLLLKVIEGLCYEG